jgi:OFA family oxalate/formate antiporter-like MFS transporter
MGVHDDGVHEAPASRQSALLANPWVQLATGIVAMVAITNLQYGWTFFVEPLRTAFGWEKAAIQVGFTLFVLAETWLVPVEGYFVDRLGPRPLVLLGGLLAALGWVINATADSLGEIYLGNVMAGIGAGIIYGASIGNALKWFPQRRGLAAGLTAAAFGAGSALTVVPLLGLIRGSGYQAAFQWFGLGQGALVVLCALIMRTPPDTRTGSGSAVAGRDYRWQEVARTPVFWLMYLMFTMVTLGGLMTVAQLEPIARHYQVADVQIAVLGRTYTALALAAILDRLLNGLTRPLFGWISDHLGRANTMFVAFSLEGAALVLLLQLAHDPVLFVLLTGLTFFAWGEVYSLFPALCGDLFGRKFVTTNYGLLYTAKGTAALLVPLGNILQEACDSWAPVFWIAAVLNGVTALVALVALKPLAARFQASRGRQPAISPSETEG